MLRLVWRCSFACLLLGSAACDHADRHDGSNGNGPDERDGSPETDEDEGPPPDDGEPSGSNGEPRGLTWGVNQYDVDLDVQRVGCHGFPKLDATEANTHHGSCNPYAGDTECSASLPILCLLPEGVARPPYEVVGQAHAMPVEYYNGWAGGPLGLTVPIAGTELTSAEAGDAHCAQELGPGFRMLRHSDGRWIEGMDAEFYYDESWPLPEDLQSGGWSLFAYGEIETNTRFWVNVATQRGNCWDG